MRRFGNAKVVLDQGLVFDDDGNIFDADGAFVGTVEAQTAEAPPSGDNNDAGPSEPPIMVDTRKRRAVLDPPSSPPPYAPRCPGRSR